DAEVAGRGDAARDNWKCIRITSSIQRRCFGPHADVAVGAVGFAQAATDAVAFDFDFGAFAAVNGVNGAADEAVGVFATAAGAGDEKLAEAKAVAFEARNAAVGVGAGFGAFVAAGAAFQIKDQEFLGIE